MRGNAFASDPLSEFRRLVMLEPQLAAYFRAVLASPGVARLLERQVPTVMLRSLAAPRLVRMVDAENSISAKGIDSISRNNYYWG